MFHSQTIRRANLSPPQG